MYSMNRRHTVTVNEETYRKLQRCGTFNESYSQLISRLIDMVESASQRKSTELEGDVNYR
jgi:predicted CopG family antitoxin